jgi:hypothetical protein
MHARTAWALSSRAADAQLQLPEPQLGSGYKSSKQPPAINFIWAGLQQIATSYGPVCNRSPHRYAPDPVAGRVVRLPSRASGDSTTIGGALGRRLQLDHPLSAGTACRQRPQTCARLTWIYGSTPRSLLCGSSVREVENLLARCNVKVKTAQNVQSKRQRRPAA